MAQRILLGLHHYPFNMTRVFILRAINMIRFVLRFLIGETIALQQQQQLTNVTHRSKGGNKQRITTNLRIAFE